MIIFSTRSSKQSQKGGLVMKMQDLSLLEWQQRFGTEDACAEALTQVRWPS
jgi:hypothetical protein